MLIIPAIDLKGGRCVRLTHGDPNQETVYSADPVDAAKRWASLGAKRLHVVDLDAALGTGTNLEIAFKIKESVSCEVEFGGGLRDLAAVRRVLSRGIDKAIIGTALFTRPDWVKEAVSEFGDRLMAGVDAKDGEVRLQGWQAGSGVKMSAALGAVEAMGFRELIFTDISKDGALSGPNVDATRLVLQCAKLDVYASGGVTTLDDIETLKSLEPEGLKGCIVGKALYDGRLDFHQALKLC